MKHKDNNVICCTPSGVVTLSNGGSPLLATQGMFDWVDILEGKLDSMSPVGTDLETVKQQIVELKVKVCLVHDVRGVLYQLRR